MYSACRSARQVISKDMEDHLTALFLLELLYRFIQLGALLLFACRSRLSLLH